MKILKKTNKELLIQYDQIHILTRNKYVILWKEGRLKGVKCYVCGLKYMYLRFWLRISKPKNRGVYVNFCSQHCLHQFKY